MVLNYIALFVIAFLLVMVAAAIVWIGSLPGKIAHRRGHPQPDAVNAASWISFLTLALCGRLSAAKTHLLSRRRRQ